VIFALRAILVSLAFFSILYGVLSLSLVLTWRLLRFFRIEKRFTPGGLLALRLSPFAISAGISLCFTLPSFLLFERHSLDEDMGTFLLAGCAALILGAGICRVLVAEVRTRRITSRFSQGAVPLEGGPGVLELIAPHSVIPMMLVGIRVPRILISAAARKVLSQGELRAAVRHETAHLRSRDNLKKAIFNCLPFPGLASLERTWQEASELAADARAVSSRDEALDLAAALIKLARHFPCEAAPALATGLVSAVDSVTVRVEHLVAWKKTSATRRDKWRCLIGPALLAFFGFIAKLGPALALVHSITERLVP